MTMKVDTYYILNVRRDGRYEDEVISGPYYSIDKAVRDINILYVGIYDVYNYYYDIKRCKIELELEEVDAYDKRGIKGLYD